MIYSNKRNLKFGNHFLVTSSHFATSESKDTAAVLYVRSNFSDGRVDVQILSSKSRADPVKPQIGTSGGFNIV